MHGRRFTHRRAVGVISLLIPWLTAAAVAVPPNKVLFDATKAQMAGNADWVIDADLHNVGTGTGGAMTVGAGSDSNPQRYPTPAASGITASTTETYWTGALSSWGVALVKKGFQVETLPVGGRITFGDSTNAQDLSNYGIYVVDEPNIRFTTAEKTAIVNFVAAGGGLFMIGDHTGSDRNNDGADAPVILNDLVNANGVATNVFGITFNSVSVSLTSSYVATSATDPLIHGAAGAVSQMQYSSGTTLTITGSNTHGAIWQTSARSSSSLMVAYATYGQGKVVACGDSSPFDDGTGDPGDTLYTGWAGEVSGDHGRLAINACLWLNPSVACPVAVTQPVSLITCPHTAASFTFVVNGGGTLAYQWRRNGVAISSASNASAVTRTLVIPASSVSPDADYDCIVTNACGSVTSAAASLITVTADYNLDGGVDGSDVSSFFADWELSMPGADLNQDGGIDAADLEVFFRQWESGC
jgi:hypothetical protein